MRFNQKSPLHLFQIPGCTVSLKYTGVETEQQNVGLQFEISNGLYLSLLLLADPKSVVFKVLTE